LHSNVATPRSAALYAAGACWAGAALIYLVSEALAAWRFSPAYSYRRNFISELGVPQCIRMLHDPLSCSPLHAVMNLGFVAEGTLFILAVALVFPSLHSLSRYAFGVIGAGHGIGLMLVGLFHAAGANVASGGARYHLLGATLAIFGGNIAIIFSPVAKDLSGPSGLQAFGKIAGSIGILAAAMFTVTVARQKIFALDYASWERLSVYTILTWDALVGGWLIARPRNFTATG
jgi:hypothetical membrane protein